MDLSSRTILQELEDFAVGDLDISSSTEQAATYSNRDGVEDERSPLAHAQSAVSPEADVSEGTEKRVGGDVTQMSADDVTPPSASTSGCPVRHRDVIAALRNVLVASRGSAPLSFGNWSTRSPPSTLSRHLNHEDVCRSIDPDHPVIPTASGLYDVTAGSSSPVKGDFLIGQNCAEDAGKDVAIRPICVVDFCGTATDGPPSELSYPVPVEEQAKVETSETSESTKDRTIAGEKRQGRPLGPRRAGTFKVRAVAPPSLRQFYEKGGRDYDEFLSRLERRQNTQTLQPTPQTNRYGTPTRLKSSFDQLLLRRQMSPAYRPAAPHAGCRSNLPTSVYDKPCPPYPLAASSLTQLQNASSLTSLVVTSSDKTAVASPLWRSNSAEPLPMTSMARRGMTSSATDLPLTVERLDQVDEHDIYCPFSRKSHGLLPADNENGSAPSRPRPRPAHAACAVSPGRDTTAADGNLVDLSLPKTSASGINAVSSASVQQRLKSQPNNLTVPAGAKNPVSGQNFATAQKDCDVVTPRTFGGDVRLWNVDDVVRFVSLVPGCKEYAELFRQEKIDGVSFAHLTEDHLLNVLKMHLGPAVRLRIAIDTIRRRLLSPASATPSDGATNSY